MTTKAISAQGVSRQLRKAGFVPSFDRRREGVRVRRSEAGIVTVTADLDRPGEAARLSEDLADALKGLGYEVTRRNDHVVAVGRPEYAPCAVCGSDNLFSGFFDFEGYAVPDDSGDGWRWTTYCNQCGAEQS
jgi:hypothetical protein